MDILKGWKCNSNFSVSLGGGEESIAYRTNLLLPFPREGSVYVNIRGGGV